ncbi:hypothetical protein WA026_000487 [Henosepilachna vigintioctopunctata]|uniref:MPN domain-containing protein n=1 Tax=Henosepilachna vigintioctopunctata TaxID=420089 RepID=A0AAW1V0L5_9CUCU
MDMESVEKLKDINDSIDDHLHCLADLEPSRRLEILQATSKKTRIDPTFPMEKYYDLSEGLLFRAKQFQEKGNNEIALLHYLRYQEFYKKMKRHCNFLDIPIYRRSTFDYKLKTVARKVKQLTEIVLKEYEKMYKMADIGIQIQDFDLYQEQRPTVSTVRTFVSGNESPFDDSYSRAISENRLSMFHSNSRESKVSKESISFSMRSRTDTMLGIRRSIFPIKQVREFEQIHRQRRIVRSHRTLRIPSRTTTEFSHLSFKNMKKNVETVGYLAGKEVHEQEFVVTHLILPEQFGYSDFFKVKDSHMLIRYLEHYDLLILGWIHSHPSTSPFLSSSDMHYQSIFQSVLPEAVAIVYSSVDMKSTIFNLTPNHGLGFILSCRKKGFHVHPTNPPIVMVSQHAVIDLYGDLEVKDFRNTRYFVEDDEKRIEGDIFERNIRAKSNETQRYRKSEVVFVHLS